MHPAKTPELTALLAPALNAARDAAEVAKAALDTGDTTDKNYAATIREEYESLRDKAVSELSMSTINTLFAKADEAIDSGDAATIDLLRNSWDVAQHPLATQLCEVDTQIRELEDELTSLRAARNELASRAMVAGLTQYQLAKAVGRSETTVHGWRAAHMKKQYKLA